MHFQAYAKIHKFKEAIAETVDAELPDKDSDALDENTDKDKILAKRQNEIAMASLTMAFTKEEQMGYIYEAQTDDYPDSIAFLVTRQLLQKYKPTGTMSRIELRQQLNQIKMNKNEDPKTLFEQIGAVRNAYNTKTRNIDEEDLIAVILDAAPEEHQAVLTAEQRAHKKDNDLNCGHLAEAMQDHFRMLSQNGKSGNEN